MASLDKSIGPDPSVDRLTNNSQLIFWRKHKYEVHRKYLTKILRKGTLMNKTVSNMANADAVVSDFQVSTDRSLEQIEAKTNFREPVVEFRAESGQIEASTGVGAKSMVIAFAGAASGAIAIGENFQTAVVLGVVATTVLKGFDVWWKTLD